jgi:hypothetical protein
MIAIIFIKFSSVGESDNLSIYDIIEVEFQNKLDGS